MATHNPPYDIPVHSRYRETAFDDLPKWLQNRIDKYTVAALDDDPLEADVPEQEPVTGEPRPATGVEEDGEEDLDESGDPMPVDVDFPFHKGGGYYVLSDGRVVRGQDDAEEAQANL